MGCASLSPLPANDVPLPGGLEECTLCWVRWCRSLGGMPVSGLRNNCACFCDFQPVTPSQSRARLSIDTIAGSRLPLLCKMFFFAGWRFKDERQRKQNGEKTTEWLRHKGLWHSYTRITSSIPLVYKVSETITYFSRNMILR